MSLGSNCWEIDFYFQRYNVSNIIIYNTYVVIFIYNRVCKSNFKIESKHIEVAEDVKAPVDDGHDSGLEYEDSTTRAYFEKLENYPRSDILRQKFVVDAFEEVREN